MFTLSGVDESVWPVKSVVVYPVAATLTVRLLPQPAVEAKLPLLSVVPVSSVVPPESLMVTVAPARLVEPSQPSRCIVQVPPPQQQSPDPAALGLSWIPPGMV